MIAPYHSFQRALRPSHLVAIAVAGWLVCAPAAQGQTITSRPVVQPLPSQDTQRLNRALIELAKAPSSVPALLEAGNAALAINDLDAALGFFKRLTDLEPENEPATLGLARVYLRSGRPVMAYLYFDAAKARGAGALAIGSDLALTLDLLGDHAAAQDAYLRQIDESPNDNEARRRLAVSYAISGRASAFETTLRPLVERRDFAAFRARAFGLAIMGKQERASAIAEAVMPPVLAREITPYLEFMPRLTPSQQAAAANLGIFPRAADIGQDPPAVVAYRNRLAQEPSAPLAQGKTDGPDGPQEGIGLDESLVPAGVPLGEFALDGTAPVPMTAPDAAAMQAASQPDADGVPKPEPEPEPESDAVSEPAPLAEAGPAAKPEPEPEPVRHPSRIWVQLATGRDLEALRFDWRRFTRKAPGLLGDFTAHTVPWGQANRLLAGPIDSRESARELINALKQNGFDTFRYISPQGTQIQELEAR